MRFIGIDHAIYHTIGFADHAADMIVNKIFHRFMILPYPQSILINLFSVIVRYMKHLSRLS